MANVAILILCLQACLVQQVFSKCGAINTPIKNKVNPARGVSAPNLGFAAPVVGSKGCKEGYRGWAGGPWGGFGSKIGYGARPSISFPGPIVGCYSGEGSGNVGVCGDFPVAGRTAIDGQVPIAGSIQFTGTAPAAGKVVITGTCTCGYGAAKAY